MPTNPPTIIALSKMASLIDEIAAWNKLLKKHLGQHKRQRNPYTGHSYEYDGKTRKIVVRDKNGKVVTRY